MFSTRKRQTNFLVKIILDAQVHTQIPHNHAPAELLTVILMDESDNLVCCDRVQGGLSISL